MKNAVFKDALAGPPDRLATVFIETVVSNTRRPSD